MSILSRLEVGTPVIVKTYNGFRMPGVVSFINKELTYVSVLVRRGKSRAQDVKVVMNNSEMIESGLELNTNDEGWVVWGKAIEQGGDGIAGSDVPEYKILCNIGAKRAENNEIGTNTYSGWMRLAGPFISEDDAQVWISQTQSCPPTSHLLLWP